MLRNLLALIGVLAIAALVMIGYRFSDYIAFYQGMDDESRAVYAELAERVIDSGSAVEAMTVRVPVEEGLSADDVEETMRYVANELNIKNVGELPLSKQLESMTDQPHRTLKIYMFCNPLTAAQMLEYNDAYSAYLPCRISLVEDKQGKLWLHTLNMDLMIYGGTPLPPELKEEALKVREVIMSIMKRGAIGDF